MENKKLNIIRFIEEHPSDWESLLTQKPYALKIKRATFGNGCYVMFNYDMIESDNYDPIVAEARGLVLCITPDKQVEVVRKGFNRFFNIGEGPAAKIDWDSAEASIKEDGTLVFASYYYGSWHFGTRQNFDLVDAELNSELYPTFQDLWDEAVKGCRFLHENNLVKGNTYCFELCSRYNRIVIDYPQPKIFLLAVFLNASGYEWDRVQLEGEARILDCSIPERYKLASEEDYARLVENFGVEHEGLVIRDKFGNRVKMKSKLYFDLHKSVSNGAMDREAIVGLVRAGEQAEFLSYFPEYKEKFEEIESLVAKANETISTIRHEAVVQRNSGMTRKDFAMLHKDQRCSALWFKAWEDKLTDDFIASISNEKFLEIFG